MVDITCVVDARAVLGEGTIWDPASEVLWWIDIWGKLIHRYNPATGTDDTWETPEFLGCIGLREKGGLILTMVSGFYFFDPATSQFTPIADPEAHMSDTRFNDGKPDRQGRFWAGSMDDLEKQASGGLYRLGTDLKAKRMVDGIICSNSLCWSPDGRTMYYADSWAHTIWAWDFDTESGEIANRRIFVQRPASEGAPDGATVDAEGGVWVAYWGGWCVTRFDSAGKVERVVKLPVKQPTCPAFGGPDLDICYVTSAAIGGDPQPLSGGIFAFEPGMKGLPEAYFKG